MIMFVVMVELLGLSMIGVSMLSQTKQKAGTEALGSFRSRSHCMTRGYRDGAAALP